MITWRSWLTTFLASLVAATAAIPLVGNALPEPHGSFIPMLEGHDFVRDEFVRQRAMAEIPKPCVALLGDSRTAFNISGAVVDRYLPDGCSSQNYGFASLRLSQIRRMIEDMPAAETLVLSISETMLYPSPHDERIEDVLAARWIRYLYLGLYRVKHIYGPKPENGWNWSREEKRWHFRGLDQRTLIESPSYKTEVTSMAASYFAALSLDNVDELRSLLAWVATRAKKLVVVLPPSEAMFQKASDRFGNQRRYWQMIANSARDAGAILIDCSQTCVGQGDFADPVHLSARGAVNYSTELGKRIAAQISAP